MSLNYRFAKRALAVFLWATIYLLTIADPICAQNSRQQQRVRTTASAHACNCPNPADSAPPPLQSRIDVLVGAETEAGILFRAIVGNLRLCSTAGSSVEDMNELDTFIVGDQEGRITEQSRILLYSHSRIDIVCPNGNVKRCDDIRRIPAEDVTLTQLLSTCPVEEARCSPQDLIGDLNSKMRIVQVPRFVEIDDAGSPCYIISPRTLAAREAVDVQSQTEGAAFAAVLAPKVEQELLERMRRVNWDYVLKILYSRTKPVEVQAGEAVLPDGTRGKRVLKRVGYPKFEIEGYSPVIRDFVKDCQHFWESVSKETARLENEALELRGKRVQENASQTGASLP